MKWILNESKKYKSIWLLCNSSIVIFDFLSILNPILLGFIIDEGLQKQNYQLLIFLSLFLIIFTIIKAWGTFSAINLLSYTCHKMTSVIRKKCYQKLNQLDLNFYKKNTQGELMTTLISDIKEVRRFAHFTYKNIIHSVTRFIGSLIYCL